MSEDWPPDEQYCNNCKKNIASNNFIMHEVHCKRHIELCKKCNEPVPKSSNEDHFNQYHIEVDCQQCKMKVEKNKLESHKESECPNKPANCSYCELEMMECDLLDHEGYCGTRTEPCVSCEQYVMIKDFTRHVESGCTYPTPKSQVPSTAATNTSELYDLGMDPFTFDEIHRMLDEAAVPSHASLIPAEGEQQSRWFHTPSQHTVRNNTSNSSHKNTTNRRSEVNKQKELASVSTNIRYDSMLSSMLSPSRHSNDGLTQYMEAFQKQTEVPVLSGTESSGSSGNINRHIDDDVLPCEFCGHLFTPDFIIQHQSGCDLLSSQTWPSSNDNAGESRNNEIQPEIQKSTAYIPVINNLDSSRQQKWQSTELVDNVSDFNNDDIDNDGDDVMLPCEFCTELFPVEMLCIHQSICDANTTVTPRVMTPVTTYQVKRKKQDKPLNYMTDDHFNTARSSRQQAPPLDVDNQDYETVQNNNVYSHPFSLYNRRDMLSNRHTTTSNNNSSTSNKRSNGDISVRKSSRTKNASHTQETLDSLLQDDPHVLISESSRTSERRSGVLGAAGGAERKKKGTPISAKKVVQELERNDNMRQTLNKRFTMRPDNDDADKESTTSSTRQRSTHLLNADKNRSRTLQQPKFNTKSKNIPRR